MTDNALFESPDVRGLRLVQAALRVSVSLACWGAVATVFHQQSAPLTCTLKNVYNLAPDACHKIENICACVLIVCGLVTLSRPLWPALLLIGIWFTAASSVHFYEDGSSLPALVPIEHAVRFLTPWALILVDFFPPRLKFGLARFLAAMVMLRLGIVASLLGTGLRAILDSRSSHAAQTMCVQGRGVSC